MRSRLYIVCLIVAMSIFTYKSDSQNGPVRTSFVSAPAATNISSIDQITNEPSRYCIAGGQSIAFGWIDEVTVGQYGFASGSNAGFANLTSREFDIDCGAFNSFDIKSGQTNGNKKHNWRVWIDYDQDGTFSNDEHVISNYSVHMKGLVYIPQRAKQTYRTSMRIAMNRDDIPNSCGRFRFGEVEDYTVVLKVQEPAEVEETLSNRISKSISKHKVNVYPNPVTLLSPINLSYNAESETDVKLTTFSIDGRLVDQDEEQAKVGNNVMNIEGMMPESGVYILKVQIGTKNFIKKITVIN